jgi:hypothetical protein
MTARDPLRVMFAAITVELGLLVASWLVPPSETSFLVQRWASLALGVVLAGTIAWAQRARRGAASEPCASVPWWIAGRAGATGRAGGGGAGATWTSAPPGSPPGWWSPPSRSRRRATARPAGAMWS